MNLGSRAVQTGALFCFLAWFAAVLLRYERVDSAEPLVAVALCLGWVTLLSAAAVGAGAPLWRALGGGRGGAEDLLLGAGLGCVALVSAGWLLSLAGWFRPLPLGVLLLVAAGLGVRELRRAGGAVWRWAGGRQLRPLGYLLAGVALVTLLVTVAASPFYDQYHYHLGFPYQWLRLGHMEVFPRHAYSYFPAAMGVLFAYPLPWLGTWSAQAVHWWTGAVTVLATAALAGRLGGPRAAVVAAALLACTPAVMQVATWAAADLGAAAFGALAWLALARLWRGDAAGWGAWLVVGLLAGLAAAAKLVALATVVGPVLVAGALAPRQAGPPLTTRLACMGVGVGLTLGPWALRSFLASGDPFYPFGTAYVAPLLGAAAGPAAELAARIVAGEAGVHRPALVATLSTFHPEGDAGLVGPAYLAFLPLAGWGAARGVRRGSGLLALGAALALAGWAWGPPRGRYLLPALPLLAALSAAGWGRARACAPPRTRRALAGLLLGVLLWSASGAASPVEVRRLAVALGAADGEELLRRYVSYWGAIRAVNSTLPAHARLLLVGESRPYLLDRDLVVEDPFQRPLLAELAEAAADPLDIAAALRALGVTHLLINPQEGRRMAAMNGRDRYLTVAPGAAERHLEVFLRRCTVPAVEAPPVVVLALQGCPP